VQLANVAGRATILGPDSSGLDVAKASDGRFPADPQALYEQWDEFAGWAATQTGKADEAVEAASIGAPTPMPRQVFAIGLNYGDHADEAHLGRPEAPPVFTKFPTSITGPYATVTLPSESVDWEVELVAVIGRRAQFVSEGDAWSHVAGLTIGQDLSERVVQLVGPAPQFSLGKSFVGFAPVGPALVTLDEVDHYEDLALSCRLGDEVLQSGRTSQMLFQVPELIARLSAVCPLLPGDIIFTGTPSGVGVARDPKRFLPVDGVLTSTIEGLGEMRQTFVAGPTHPAA
jgi:2-keto-4-pentenoate hydratase/2-oxohepta-3-ene-1,7-dioic acid hydratase in catechol pathway